MRHELGIKAAAGQQFVVCAAFDHLTLIQRDDLVGAAHGGEPMGNHQRGAVGHQRFKGLAHRLLVYGIKMGRRFIQDQPGRF